MTRRIDLVEQGKMIRQELAERFGKSTKFSVKSKRYSGGCSIDVTWTDGPTVPEVDRILNRYEGASFDGMQDLESLKPQERNGETVQYEGKYVFSNRKETEGLRDTVNSILVERFPQIIKEGEFYGWTWYPTNGAWTSGIEWDRIVNKARRHYDATTGEFILTDLLNGYIPDNWQYHENPEPEPMPEPTPAPTPSPRHEPVEICPIATGKPKTDELVSVKFSTIEKLPTLAEFKGYIDEGTARVSRCKVQRIVFLTPEDYDLFAANMQDQQDWLQGSGGAGVDGEDWPTGEFWTWNESDIARFRAECYVNVVAVTAVGRESIAINTEGHDYARCVGFFLAS